MIFPFRAADIVAIRTYIFSFAVCALRSGIRGVSSTPDIMVESKSDYAPNKRSDATSSTTVT
jgi:hypothetical protein